MRRVGTRRAAGYDRRSTPFARVACWEAQAHRPGLSQSFGSSTASKIRLMPVNAANTVARKTDTTKSGTIAAAVATPMAGTNVVTLTYTDSEGATTLLTLTFVGLDSPRLRRLWHRSTDASTGGSTVVGRWLMDMLQIKQLPDHQHLGIDIDVTPGPIRRREPARGFPGASRRT